ncbi:MAG TPA: OmpH family outer membrane protein [Syntrophales bacterium]|jgi:outer membrane protein|nr:OmpH family outer membrane protein [Syntrophales bacterium]HON23076.1 OmpH family outer membrane protein [Syntrophales bacterium]HOU78362.1 OmpH family outer membrane protein [Syntrophales bacterium]HPC33470.1 OmpH family outer membrane protein [Syntrophales bacterium]HQG34834.1 OmpH family outer membrane protein [Syntrophales bacterium]
MKRFLFVVVVLGAALSLLTTVAAPSWAEKIGFIHVEEILMNSDVGKAAGEEIKKSYEKNRATIQEKEKELQRLKDELEKQRAVLNEKALRDKEQSYQKKYRDYQDLVKDANEEMQSRRQEFLGKNVPEILKVVAAIGEKENYTLIIDLSTVPVAYHAKGNSLTQRVIDEFNKAKKSK